jgi:hypothetical protein
MVKYFLIAVLALWGVSFFAMFASFLHAEFIKGKQDKFGSVFGKFWYVYLLLSLASPVFYCLALGDILEKRKERMKHESH